MERLKNMKDTLIGCVQSQLCNLQSADYKELGAAIDMIKDLSEAVYYCTIIESMDETENKKEKEIKIPVDAIAAAIAPAVVANPALTGASVAAPMDYDMNYREADRQYGRMYYSGGSGSQGGGNSDGSQGGSRSYGRGNDARGGGTRGFYETEYPQLPLDMRDSREGKSPMSRRSYMESKEMHQPKEMKMKELEKYMHELSQDLSEMIVDASLEEKQMLQKKIAALATKLDV